MFSAAVVEVQGTSFIRCSLRRVICRCRRCVPFHGGVVFQDAQYTIGSDDDFIARFHPARDFNVRCTGDASLDGHEDGTQFSPFFSHYENSLNGLRFWSGGQTGIHLLRALLFSSIRNFHDQGLQRNCDNVVLVRRGDLGGCRETRAKFRGGIVRVTTTLKSFASSVPVVLWLVDAPVDRSSA